MKKGIYGFSFTYLFFGFFVPLFRGEILIAALHLIFSSVTFGLWHLISCFIYNKQYTTRMLTDGWELAGNEEQNARARAVLKIAPLNEQTNPGDTAEGDDSEEGDAEEVTPRGNAKGVTPRR
jgi:hypothetical protein